ncbi:MULTISPECIES: hypothetical protein [Staphylococcus]|nr:MULTISPECIES: hypothetical protein [Staphylococcus]MDM8328069.1 hypothetical protein [Staphylococcus felis]
MDRLQRQEIEARIAESKSNTFRNYCLGIATLASIIKLWWGI